MGILGDLGGSGVWVGLVVWVLVVVWVVLVGLGVRGVLGGLGGLGVVCICIYGS